MELKTIIDLVNDYYETDISLKTRKREVSEPRQVYMYLSINLFRRNTKMFTFREISEAVGLTNHATTIHGAKRIADLIEYDKHLKSDIDFLKGKINDLRIYVY